MKLIEDEGLVSVVVISYNSENTIIETLESIKNQSYNNLELIVSDDCSIDNTLNVCRSWLSNTAYRFKNIELITSDINKGIPSNCNRGIKVSSSNYVKLIAADDVLYPNAIETYVKTAMHSEASFFISNMKLFYGNFTDVRNVKVCPRYLNALISKDPRLQFNKLLKDYFGCAPTFFFKKDTFVALNYFDESIVFMEDYPFALKATQSGYYYEYIDEELVYYRIRENSVSGSVSSNKLFNDFYNKKHIVSKKLRYPYVNIFVLCNDYYEYYLHFLFDHFDLNKNQFINKVVYLIFIKINFLRYFK